jgi:hypothetical protein
MAHHTAKGATPVSHLVTYDADNGPVYRKVDELHEAISLVEQLRNDLGLEQARIYRLEEVSFEFRPYFRVAIAEGPAASGWGDPFAAAYPATGAGPAAAATAEAVGEDADADAEAEVEQPDEDRVEPVAATSGSGGDGYSVFAGDRDDKIVSDDAAVVWRESEVSPGVDADAWAAVAGGGARSAEDRATLPQPPGARRNIFGR